MARYKTHKTHIPDARDISVEGWESYERAKAAYEKARDKLHAASIACSDARFSAP